MEKADHLSADEMMLTSTFTISKDDYDRLRQEIREVTASFLNQVEQSRPEILVNLNIDLIKY